MTFQITPLPREAFAALFGLSDAELQAQGARRVRADESPGFPCRVSLEDAAIGEALVLVNHQHVQGNTPYAASHAVFVREAARTAQLAPGAVPVMFAHRQLSLRGFDAGQMMRRAELIDGKTLAATLEAIFAAPEIAFIDIHFAAPGCFAARAIRAG